MFFIVREKMASLECLTLSGLTPIFDWYTQSRKRVLMWTHCCHQQLKIIGCH